MNLARWLEASARLHPDAPALLRGTAVVADYKSFAARAAAIGAGLARDFGIGPGDRVALFMSNATQYLECLYAVWWIGGVVIPINAKLHGREAAWIMDNAGARLVVVDDDSRKALVEVAEDLTGMTMLSIDSEEFRALQHGEGGAA